MKPLSVKMITFTGKLVDPLLMSIDDICIEDIAHHLSLLCRWGGACREFYSVAQHSIYVSHICDEQDRLWGLLHDAAEAYICDMIRPIKESLRRHGEGYDLHEQTILGKIAAKFNLPKDIPDSVLKADELAWKNEWNHLIPGLTAKSDGLICFSPTQAEMWFLDRFNECK